MGSWQAGACTKLVDLVVPVGAESRLKRFKIVPARVV